MNNDDDVHTNNRTQQQQQFQNQLSPLLPIQIPIPRSNNSNNDSTPFNEDTSYTNQNNRYLSPTISALVRGLHDPRRLQLTLFETDDEEEDKENMENKLDENYVETKRQQSDQKLEPDDKISNQTGPHSPNNIGHITNSSNTLTNTSPIKMKSTTDLRSSPQEHEYKQEQQQQFHLHHLHQHLFHLHPSLPRLVVDLAASDSADNNNGDKKLESHVLPSPGGARRLSQFNFNLRRFSHTHNSTVLFYILFLDSLCVEILIL